MARELELLELKLLQMAAGRGEKKTERRGKNGERGRIRTRSGKSFPTSCCPRGTGECHGEAGGGGGRRGRSPLCQKAEEEDDPAPGGLGLLRRQVRVFFLFFLFYFVSVLLTIVFLFISAPKWFVKLF